MRSIPVGMRPGAHICPSHVAHGSMHSACMELNGKRKGVLDVPVRHAQMRIIIAGSSRAHVFFVSIDLSSV
jgi:hypothetical protein